jgi:hypothetical protein
MSGIKYNIFFDTLLNYPIYVTFIRKQGGYEFHFYLKNDNDEVLDTIIYNIEHLDLDESIIQNITNEVLDSFLDRNFWILIEQYPIDLYETQIKEVVSNLRNIYKQIVENPNNMFIETILETNTFSLNFKYGLHDETYRDVKLMIFHGLQLSSYLHIFIDDDIFDNFYIFLNQILKLLSTMDFDEREIIFDV